MPYKNVLYIKRLRIISGTRRALQICPSTYTFGATAVERGLIFFRSDLTSIPLNLNRILSPLRPEE